MLGEELTAVRHVRLNPCGIASKRARERRTHHLLGLTALGTAAEKDKLSTVPFPQ